MPLIVTVFNEYICGRKLKIHSHHPLNRKKERRKEDRNHTINRFRDSDIVGKPCRKAAKF